MYVRKQMTKDVICVDRKAKMSDAIDLMNEHHLHRLPVRQ